MKLSRRGWNNVIIFAVLMFIAAIQLPPLIKEKFGTTVKATVDEAPLLVRLLPSDANITQLILPARHYQREGEHWLLDGIASGDTAPIMHWRELTGTPVEPEVMAKLKPQLTQPTSVEIWLATQAEPVRVTVYQLPQFWLLQNWQAQWLAVSVEPSYLFPVPDTKREQ
ncbi:hypothetical protein A3K86_08670 [Photobacterium jeanii]|uniref:Uncharacterized protein n=1 Tax=Photobacterium jeanii TaxID=858640 RepID=A0A178KI94_9GAMM|nr:hypothetical protein [Photobacterium jeanii]OAN16997.1 hypothetical protein A3K86_08670 [Photobacterium jeanii]PST88287.1 hypothetical protein C9I91_16980 [Photobacterium jeanii]